MILQAQHSTYIEDSADAISYMSRQMAVVLVSLWETRELLDAVISRGGELSKIAVIDAASRFLGYGTPFLTNMVSIARPTDINDIQVYSSWYTRLIGKEGGVLIITGIDKLQSHLDLDEIGLFIHTMRRQMKQANVYHMVITHEDIGVPLKTVLSQSSSRQMPIAMIPAYLEELNYCNAS
ncbi:MAG: hypothetical protein HGA85_06125 [Nanoarchaeota archaeon]|nr:hypothetical protein [Nanoarchaeota archaeon]